MAKMLAFDQDAQDSRDNNEMVLAGGIEGEWNPDTRLRELEADGIAGEIVPREDPLPMRDAWANTFYAQFDVKRWESINVINKFKYEFIRQIDYEDQLANRRVLPSEDIRDTASFFGLINKIDYIWEKGGLTLQPADRRVGDRHGNTSV